MIKKILLATKNNGKIEEFKKMFGEFNIEVLSLRDFDIEEPEENGKTFQENSAIKAKYYAEKLKISSIADDSGLCINALNGFPSIYSARINGSNKDYNNTFNFLKILLNYNNLTDYSAFFICNVTFCDYDKSEIFSFEGRVDGVLDFTAKGTDGFGYDPIFIPNGYTKTFAELNMEEKNKISHRGVAFNNFIKWFKEYNK